MPERADERALPLLRYSSRSGDPRRPEEALVVAVLEHAVGIFQRHSLATDRGGRMLFANIDAWFASDDDGYPFAFVSICDALGLDVAYVRSGLRQWRESGQDRRRLKAYVSRLPFRKPALHPESYLRAVPTPSAFRRRVVPSARRPTRD